jgi:acetyltransferase-like isoleucine patch superfamily enzyme
MTLLSRLLSFFPTLVMAIALSCVVWILIAPSLLSIFALLFSLYGFPLVVYRLHQRFYPVKEGISYLLTEEYSPWWGTHQIQAIYNSFPVLETILQLVPGLFSFWLRLWGAKVGSQVYWTPSVNIIDRGLLEIGDRVIFGHLSATSSHVIKPKRNDLMLYVKKVRIGNNVFFGAGTAVGPGANVADGAYVPFSSVLYPEQKVEVCPEL